MYLVCNTTVPVLLGLLQPATQSAEGPTIGVSSQHQQPAVCGILAYFPLLLSKIQFTVQKPYVVHISLVMFNKVRQFTSSSRSLLFCGFRRVTNLLVPLERPPPCARSLLLY